MSTKANHTCKTYQKYCGSSNIVLIIQFGNHIEHIVPVKRYSFYFNYVLAYRKVVKSYLFSCQSLNQMFLTAGGSFISFKVFSGFAKLNKTHPP